MKLKHPVCHCLPEDSIPVTAEPHLLAGFQIRSDTVIAERFLRPLHRESAQFPSQSLHPHRQLLPQKLQKNLNVFDINFFLKVLRCLGTMREGSHHGKKASHCAPKAQTRISTAPLLMMAKKQSHCKCAPTGGDIEKLTKS